MALEKARIQLLDAETSVPIKDLDVLTSDDAVLLEDGTTVRNKLKKMDDTIAKKPDTANIKIINSLTEINLSASDMTTDFSSNLQKIISAAGANRHVALYPYESETNNNLYQSIKTWCGFNTDGYHVNIYTSVNGATNIPNKIEVIPNTNNGNDKLFIGFFDNALGVAQEVAVKFENDLSSLLRNAWTVGVTCSFRGVRIGNELFIEGIIINTSISPSSTIATGLPGSRDGKYHGGYAIGSDNTCLYLTVLPEGNLVFQSNGAKQNIIYSVSIHYPV